MAAELGHEDGLVFKARSSQLLYNSVRMQWGMRTLCAHQRTSDDEPKENHMKLIVEIRAAEGGTDAKLLVADQAAIYTAFAKRIGAQVLDAHTGKG